MMKYLIFIFLCTYPLAIHCQVPGKGVTDVDGNVYPTVLIGQQEWMGENLKTTRYRNGDVIPIITDGTAWSAAIAGAYCYYDDNPANGDIYGKMYNVFAFKDTRGVCPEGWEIPTTSDWRELENYLGGQNVAGGSLKAVSDYWKSPNTGATNSTGFSALPGGFRQNIGRFWDLNERAVFAMLGYVEIARVINYDSEFIHYLGANNNTGVCVRCIKSDGINTGIASNDSDPISLFPNPVQGELNVKLAEGLAGSEYVIMDVGGRIVQKGVLNNTENKLILSDLQPGAYFFKYENHSSVLIKK